MQTLELINERFARQMRHVLLNFMRRSADITVGSIKIQKYADFERNLPVPSNLNMIQMKPLRGTALFTYDPNLVFLVIDSLFGGDGRYHTRVEGRDFTTTEQRIIQRLLNLTLESYGKSWDPVYPIDSVRALGDAHQVRQHHRQQRSRGRELVPYRVRRHRRRSEHLPALFHDRAGARPVDAPAAGDRAGGSGPALGPAAVAPGAQRRHRRGCRIRPHSVQHPRADAPEGGRRASG